MKIGHKTSLFGKWEIILSFLIFASLLMGLIETHFAKSLVVVVGIIEVIIVYSQMKIHVSLKSFIPIVLYGFWVSFLAFALAKNYSSVFFSLFVQQTILFASFFLNYKPVSDKGYMSWSNICKRLVIIFSILDFIFFVYNKYDFFSVPIFGLFFFYLLVAKNKDFSIIVMAVFMLLVRGRSTALSLLVMLLFVHIIDHVRTKRYLYNLLYWAVAILCVYIPRLYVAFYHSKNATAANLLVRRLTHKNLFSGRQLLWREAFDVIDENKLFGIGGDFYNVWSQVMTTSTHNVFLYIRIIGGYFLLIVFLLFFYYIWTQIGKNMDQQFFPLCAGYLIGLFIRINFDLTFICNNFGQSILLWFPVIFILNRCTNNSKRRKRAYEDVL